MKIVIAGYGPVGQAMHKALELREDISVFIDDPLKGFNYEPDNFTSADGVIVCVATPMADDGSCTVDNVQSVFKKYGDDMKYLVKSTVDPEWLCEMAPQHTTFSPEFLRGSTSSDSTQEFLDSTFAIYGGGEMRFWHELFKPVLRNLTDFRFVSLEQASFAKYVENCFLATKVVFFNEMYRLYKELGFKDFDTMVEAISLDERIGFSHTQVPGPDGKFGYGGHCLPKDISALRFLSDDTPLLDAVASINGRLRDG